MLCLLCVAFRVKMDVLIVCSSDVLCLWCLGLLLFNYFLFGVDFAEFGLFYWYWWLLDFCDVWLWVLLFGCDTLFGLVGCCLFGCAWGFDASLFGCLVTVYCLIWVLGLCIVFASLILLVCLVVMSCYYFEFNLVTIWISGFDFGCWVFL